MHMHIYNNNELTLNYAEADNRKILAELRRLYGNLLKVLRK